MSDPLPGGPEGPGSWRPVVGGSGEEPGDRRATPAALLALRAEEGLGAEALRRALELALEPPGPEAWRHFLDRSLLVLGTGLVCSGVFFFFAFNWADLGRLGKLGLLEAAVIATALGACSLGPESRAGSALLTVAALLLGPLLGVYGQSYPTGADPWELFAAWTLLLAPWVWAGRSTALAALVLVLVNLTAALALDQAFQVDPWEDAAFYVAMAALDGGLWAGWETLRRRTPGALGSSWATRFLGGLTLAFLVVPACQAVLDSPEDFSAAGLGLLGAVLVWLFRLSRPRDRDLFLPALGLGAAIAVVSCGVGRWLFDSLGSGTFEVACLLLGLAILAQVAGAAAWLRHAGEAP